MQIRDDSWGADIFVDLLDRSIPDRSVIKVLQVREKEKQVWEKEKQVQCNCSNVVVADFVCIWGGFGGCCTASEVDLIY